MNPQVSIIIVNWNGKKYLKDCLSSVFDQSYKNFQVILVDNGSIDNSVEFVKNNFPQVNIILLDRNFGFAKANNIAIKKVLSEGTEYIVLLNNDTKVEKNWLSELIKTMSSDIKIGICASKMLRMDNPHVLDSTGHIFLNGLISDRGSNEYDKGQYDKQLDIVGACAGACLYLREMLEEIGLFDESFGSFYEDVELSWRAYKFGWKAKYVPEAIVYHKRHGTLVNDEKLQKNMKNHYTLNIVKTIQRHATLKQRLLVTIVWLKEAVKQKIKMLFFWGKDEPNYLERLKLLWFRKI